MSNKKISCGGFFIDDTLKEEDGVLSVVGGGSSSLPEVTSEDNGDVLTVVEGAWAKAKNEGNIFIVTFTETDEQSNYVSDKTFEEIEEAYNNGKIILCNIINLMSEYPTRTSLTRMIRSVRDHVAGYDANVIGPSYDNSVHSIVLANFNIAIIEDGTIYADITYGAVNNNNNIIF